MEERRQGYEKLESSISEDMKVHGVQHTAVFAYLGPIARRVTSAR